MHRTGGRNFRHAQLVSRMGRQGIFRHQLLSHLTRKLVFDASLHVNVGELVKLGFRALAQFLAFAREFGLFGVALRTDGYRLASRHRHRASHEPRYTRDQDIALRRGR